MQHTSYLSQEKYIEKVLDRICMVDAKPVGVPLQTYDKISRDYCPKTQGAINDMQGVPYASAVVHLCMLWLLLNLIFPMQCEL